MNTEKQQKAMIPGLAGATLIWELAYREHAFRLSPDEGKAYGILTAARVAKAGIGTVWVLESDDRDAWDALIDTAFYCWESAGGNGNPFAVERASQYMSERRACKRAFDRLVAADPDGARR